MRVREMCKEGNRGRVACRLGGGDSFIWRGEAEVSLTYKPYSTLFFFSLWFLLSFVPSHPHISLSLAFLLPYAPISSIKSVKKWLNDSLKRLHSSLSTYFVSYDNNDIFFFGCKGVEGRRGDDKEGCKG